jgi:hypothetical protein
MDFYAEGEKIIVIIPMFSCSIPWDSRLLHALADMHIMNEVQKLTEDALWYRTNGGLTYLVYSSSYSRRDKTLSLQLKPFKYPAFV